MNEWDVLIEQAKGIVMCRDQCGPDRAFLVLTATSQRTNTKVRDVARALVARHDPCPHPMPTPATLRTPA